MEERKIRVLQRGLICQEENRVDMWMELESLAIEGHERRRSVSLSPNITHFLSLEVNDRTLDSVSNPFPSETV